MISEALFPSGPWFSGGTDKGESGERVDSVCSGVAENGEVV